MARKKIDESFFEAKYIDIEIKYPFCYKTKETKDGINYFRYLEDGRFENIKISEKSCAYIFGCRANSIEELLADDGFYFKVLSNLNDVIENNEFENAYKLYLIEIEKYLSASKYLSREVNKIINEKINEEIIEDEPPF